jgi:aconitate hydratase
VHRSNGNTDSVKVTCCVDTLAEVAYYHHGGILNYVLREMAKVA